MARPYKSVLTRRQLQQLAGEVRQRVEYWLDARLDRYFDQVEKTFAEAADQADDDRRAGWVEARRLLVERRARLARRFKVHLLKAVETFFLHFEAYLEEFIHGVAPWEITKRPQLVKDPGLAEYFAIKNLVERAARHQKEAGEQLVAHLAAVIQPREVPSDGIPMAPRVIANCLYLALKEWPSNGGSRVVFFHVLAEELLGDLEGLYTEVTKALARLGLEPVTTRSGCAIQGDGSRQEGGVKAEEEGVRGSLFSLIGLVRQLEERERRLLGLMPPVASPGPTATALRPEAVARALAPLAGTLAHAEDLDMARQLQAAFKQSLAETLEAAARAARLRIHCLDQQVIDVFTLLFDFLLDDELIPPGMRIRLLPLELPLIQVAVADKTVLNEGEHPARRLFNALVAAAVSWGGCVHPSSHAVRAALERAVAMVVAGDPLDLDLYRRAGSAFERLVGARMRGARVVEERVTQVARGREHLMLARRRVARVLADLDVSSLPGTAHRLVEEGWRDVLVLILLREGEASTNWQWAVEVVQRLVEGLSAPPSERLEAELPRLLGDLRRGLTAIAWDAAKIANLLERLEACWRARLRGTDLVPEICGPAPAQAARAGPLGGRGGSERVRRLVDQLEEGQWVRWQSPAGERRGKLAWRSRAADLLLFVDVRGHKLAEFSSAELQELFSRGRASLLDGVDEPFIERALRNLRLMLENHRAGPTAHPMPA